MLFMSLRKKASACVSVGLGVCAELGYNGKHVVL